MGGLAKRGTKRASVHLRFEKLARPEGRKTDHYAVHSGSAVLGGIKWYPQWRRYVFAPAGNTIFDPFCMGQISEFCSEQTDAHWIALAKTKNSEAKRRREQT